MVQAHTPSTQPRDYGNIGAVEPQALARAGGNRYLGSPGHITGKRPPGQVKCSYQRSQSRSEFSNSVRQSSSVIHHLRQSSASLPLNSSSGLPLSAQLLEVDEQDRGSHRFFKIKIAAFSRSLAFNISVLNLTGFRCRNRLTPTPRSSFGIPVINSRPVRTAPYGHR
jgi:hypothetical protein